MNAHAHTRVARSPREIERQNARNRTLLGSKPPHHAAREAGDGGDTIDPTVRVTQPAQTALRQRTHKTVDAATALACLLVAPSK